MIIKENEVLSQKYQEMLLMSNRFDRRKTLHRSDLIYCPRKAFFRMKGVEETRPSALAPLSIIGKTLHSLMEIYERREVSKSKFGIIATIDMLKEDSKPIEIKTTRATVTLETLLTKFNEWKEQLATAILFTDEELGHLFILNVISGKLSVFDLSFENEDEKVRFEWELLRRKKLIEQALQTDDFHTLPKSDWECKYCGYTSFCDG